MSANHPPAESRLHAFDALRASMMLLGVAFHAACCYTSATIGAWPYRDTRTSLVFDGVCLFLHTFRLPLFFVLSGFFAALLVARRGVLGMLRNRWQRLMVPLLLAWPILVALVIPAALFARWRHPELVLGEAWKNLQMPSEPGRIEGLLLHLWFLYDLFLFCLVAAAWILFERRFRTRITGVVRAAFRRALRYAGAPALFAVATALTLYPMHSGSFDTSAWLFPPVRILAAYGLFFWFGWLLFDERADLDVFRRSSKRRLAAGCLAFVLHAVTLSALHSHAPESAAATRWIAAMTGALACWWLIFGITGTGLKYFSTPRPWVRYLTDAAYWIYLAHLPLVLLLAGLLAPLPLPALGKFLIVSSATVVTLAVLYHYLVRNSRIGAQLNGRRYPQQWPEVPALAWLRREKATKNIAADPSV